MPNWTNDTFARNLQYYIEKSGKTQREVAEVIGVSAPTFNEWVKGKKLPRMGKIEKLANYFGCEKSDLIEDKEKPTAQDDGLSKDMVELIDELKKLPEDKIQMLLQVARSIR